MANHQNVDISAEDLQNAQKMWNNFVIGSKYCIYGLIILLIGLTIAFV